MAVAEDATSPAVAHSAAASTATTLATAAFSPPAGSLLVITAQVSLVNAFTGTPTISVALSAGGTATTIGVIQELTFKFQYGGSFYAYLPTAQTSMTVTMTRTEAGSGTMALAVRVVTGSAGTPGATLITTNNTSVAEATITPQAVGSILYLSDNYDRTAAAALTADANTTTLDQWLPGGTVGGEHSFGRLTALTTSLSPVTFGWTGEPAGYDNVLLAVEAPPAAVPARPSPARVIQRVATIRAANF